MNGPAINFSRSLPVPRRPSHTTMDSHELQQISSENDEGHRQSSGSRLCSQQASALCMHNNPATPAPANLSVQGNYGIHLHLNGAAGGDNEMCSSSCTHPSSSSSLESAEPTMLLVQHHRIATQAQIVR
jgi:hypothetical protein